MPKSKKENKQLDADEIEAIILAVKSAFLKLKNLYKEITPIFEEYGFSPPSAGVIARDLSEKIESSIVQHCSSFEKGQGFADLERFGHRWEVKICKNSGLTINQSSTIEGENYIVVNYKNDNEIRKIWILWEAKDKYFSPRKPKSNARAVLMSETKDAIETIFDSNGLQQAFELKPQAKAETKKNTKQKKRRRTGA